MRRRRHAGTVGPNVRPVDMSVSLLWARAVLLSAEVGAVAFSPCWRWSRPMPASALRCHGDAACSCSVPMRCVILTASIGAGHDLPAEILRGELMERCPAGEVEVLDCL